MTGFYYIGDKRFDKTENTKIAKLELNRQMNSDKIFYHWCYAKVCSLK